MGDKFFELVKAALPREVRPQDLTKLAPQKLWSEKPYVATAYALRKCPLLDWSIYLEVNPDVRESGMDGCLHFLQHGVYEGRKLAAASSRAPESVPFGPLVSIVIINYNNAHLLPKALGSAMGQTLKDIEIIVVDDGSTDQSREIVRDHAARDPRIRLLVNDKNSATFITRKRGVEAARGRYLMLLDSDDYMAPDACEIAAREISKGYDMVKFGAHLVNSLGAPEEEARGADKWCNSGEAREYFNEEIVTSIFRDGKMSWIIWTYISRMDLAKAALAELPDEYITGPDDCYALLAIARRSSSLLRIDKKLYFYNYGPGVSVTVDKDKLVKYAPARARAILAIERLARKYSLNIDIENLYQNLCDDLLAKFLAISARHDVSGIFNELARMLGFKAVLRGLYKRHISAPDDLANFIRPLGAIGSPMRHIGIFAPRLHYGGMEKAILTLCGVLKTLDYEVTLLLEARGSLDSAYAKYARVVYIGPFNKDYGSFSSRLLNLTDILDVNPIDAVVYFHPQRGSLLWDLLTLHHYNIPAILWLADNYGSLIAGDKAKMRQLAERMFSNADAVICQSDVEELYLRTRGINAVALHAPTAQHPYIPRTDAPARIAVVGRLGAPIKQIAESLKVLREVVKKAPWVSMCFIGDFYTREGAANFRKKARELGLEKHVTITGWTEKPEIFLGDCGAFLSVSAWESMALSISEAQALGLPGVIYDVPIDQTRDNPSIIVVPQGDYQGAAAALVSLFEDNEKWRKLSRIAVENSRKYAPEPYAAKLKALLCNFRTASPVRRYEAKDYGHLINYMSYYGGRRLGQAL